MPSTLFWNGWGDKTPERHEPPTPADQLRRELELTDGDGRPLPFDAYLERWAGHTARSTEETDR